MKQKLVVLLPLALLLASCTAVTKDLRADPSREPAKSAGTVCTQELRLSASPNPVTVRVGEMAGLKAEGVTCGGKTRFVPMGLVWYSEDPDVAAAQYEGVTGVSPGNTKVLVTSERDHLAWTFDVTVVNP